MYSRKNLIYGAIFSATPVDEDESSPDDKGSPTTEDSQPPAAAREPKSEL